MRKLKTEIRKKILRSSKGWRIPGGGIGWQSQRGRCIDVEELINIVKEYTGDEDHRLTDHLDMFRKNGHNEAVIFFTKKSLGKQLDQYFANKRIER